MCVIYHMNYEFNNWRAFFDVVEFIKKRHSKNFPTWDIKVPHQWTGYGWKELGWIVDDLRKEAPDDLEEMSIYGVISFDVTKDENLNYR